MTKNKELKKLQRAVNKYIQELNDNILNDDLWRGRFIAKQVNRYDYRYEDGSGYYFTIKLEFKDLKTGQTKIFYETIILLQAIRSKFFSLMNDFIVKDCDVWSKETTQELKNDKTIYRRK
nr:MAG TPA: hypothetical protein [Caudoviricetes sp.]